MTIDDTGGVRMVVNITTSNTNAIVNTLSCCTGYLFTVAARTSAGFGQQTVPYAFRTPASTRKHNSKVAIQ